MQRAHLKLELHVCRSDNYYHYVVLFRMEKSGTFTFFKFIASRLTMTIVEEIIIHFDVNLTLEKSLYFAMESYTRNSSIGYISIRKGLKCPTVVSMVFGSENLTSNNVRYVIVSNSHIATCKPTHIPEVSNLCFDDICDDLTYCVLFFRVVLREWKLIFNRLRYGVQIKMAKLRPVVLS